MAFNLRGCDPILDLNISFIIEDYTLNVNTHKFYTLMFTSCAH